MLNTSGFYRRQASWLADKIQVIFKFYIFFINQSIGDFILYLTKVQCNYSSISVFKLVFWLKLVVRLF